MRREPGARDQVRRTPVIPSAPRHQRRTPRTRRAPRQRRADGAAIPESRRRLPAPFVDFRFRTRPPLATARRPRPSAPRAIDNPRHVQEGEPVATGAPSVLPASRVLPQPLRAQRPIRGPLDSSGANSFLGATAQQRVAATGLFWIGGGHVAACDFALIRPNTPVCSARPQPVFPIWTALDGSKF